MSARHRDRASATRWLAHGFAVVYVALALAGIMRAYAPVPYQDRWSAVHFYAALASSGWRAWWAQHNEHRIVLPRAADWIDCELFACRGASLLALDVVLIAVMWIVLYRLARALLRGSRAFDRPYVVGVLIAVLCFSWVQRENLTQAFQITFFASALLPLAAFAAMARTSAASRSSGWFTVATALGVASAATMANGVAALPLLACMAVMLRQPWPRVALLFACAAIVAAAYFAGYDAPAHYGGIGETLRTSPWRSAQFMLAVLGGPLGVASGSVAAAALAGTVLIALALAAALRWTREPSPPALALIAFAAYAIVSAMAIAGGRLAFGVEYALSSRYLTLSLLGWAAVLVLALWIARDRRGVPRAVAAIALAASLALFAVQLLALAPEGRRVRFERMFAALDLEARRARRAARADALP